MKTLTFALMFFAAFAAARDASADFSTSSRSGKVTCTGHAMTVSIDGQRKEITVRSSYDPGHPDQYDVVDSNTDGDTYVEYVTQGNDVTLSFDDQGDSITFRDSGERIPLRCPR